MALALLDSEQLQRLERRARELAARPVTVAGDADRNADTRALAASHRVFADVVRATGENLRVLERVGGYGLTPARSRNPWDR